MLPNCYRSIVAEQAVPRSLKKYVILGELAKGGMAELFLARANGIGGFERLLVIKRVLPELARDGEFARMLLDEARIAATLQHSNIVQVFDVDLDDGDVFFAMEYLHGQHVADMVERATAKATRIPLENAIAIAVAVAAGLHYAHERWGADGQALGIVHRDVAPNNVIVTYDGNVKLIDFGIAKAANKLSTTRFGLFKGKLPYASPEQVRCQPVDRRTDVYSLGVMLYELTTGHPLFVADSEFELLRLMTEAIVPSPRLRDKAFPRELERIVLKSLARDPADRYQTAQALQRDLEVFAGNARLDLSAFSLSRLMASLFDDKLEHWMDAQRAGLTLEQHITRTTGPLTVDGADAKEIVDGLVTEDPTTSWSPESHDAMTTAEVPTASWSPDVVKTIETATAVRGQLARPAKDGRLPRAAIALAVGLITASVIVGRLVSNSVGNDADHDAPAMAPPSATTSPSLPVTPAPAPPPAADLVAPVVEPAHPTPAKPHTPPKKHVARKPASHTGSDHAAAVPAPTAPPAPAPSDDASLDDMLPRSTK